MLVSSLGAVGYDVFTRFMAMKQEEAVNGRERGELALRRGVLSRNVGDPKITPPV
jgi:hypothetical protein